MKPLNFQLETSQLVCLDDVMSTQALGIIIGGLIPALLFGFTNVLVKSATVAGSTPAWYLIIVSLAVFITGLVILWLHPHPAPPVGGGVYSFLAGLTWALGVFALSYAILHFKMPVAQLTPLYNLNTLVTVGLGLVLFAEWKQVQVPQLLLGSGLIVLGGVLVARA